MNPRKLALILVSLGAVWIGTGLARGEVLSPMLRGQVQVHLELVTLGDLFSGAGELAQTAVYRSPDLGTTGRVKAADVMAAARAAGLHPAPTGLAEISVTRVGLEIDEGAAAKLISAEVSRRLGLASDQNLEITFSRSFPTQTANLISTQPLRLASFRHHSTSGRFEARLLIDQGTHVLPVDVAGQAREMVEIFVPVRNFARGDIVRRSGLQIRRIARNTIRGGAVYHAETVVGRAAQRHIRAGYIIKAADFEEPLQVRRGDAVAITYKVPGMALTALGRALQAGPIGALVNVRNPRSRRVVQGIVTGPGRVTVSLKTQQRIARLGGIKK